MRNFFADIVFEWVWLATYRRIGNWALYYVQVIGVLLMTLNRLTCTFRPIQHNGIWSKRIKSAIVLQWLVPSIICLPMVFPVGHSYFADNQTLALKYFKPMVGVYYWKFVIILEPFILAPFFIVSYCAMVARAATTHSGDEDGSHNRTMELHLAAIGAVLSLLYVSLCLTYIAVLFSVRSDLVPGFGFYYLSDLFTASNPYLLVIFSSRAKESLATLFRANAVVGMP